MIGYARAKEYLLTGDLLTGAEAARIGLINRALPAGELDAAVDEIAQKLAIASNLCPRTRKRIPLRSVCNRR